MFISFILLLLFLISFIYLIGIFFFNSFSNLNNQKISPYESGMNPLGDARQKFKIDYILIGILFLVFDIEIVWLFPLCVIHVNLYTYWIISLFLFLLVVGFIFEYKNFSLNSFSHDS